jgi:hypothetical protein
MNPALDTLLTGLAGSWITGLVFNTAIVLGIGAFGILIIAPVWEAIERKYRCLRIKANTERH